MNTRDIFIGINLACLVFNFCRMILYDDILSGIIGLLNSQVAIYLATLPKGTNES
jgi:hypothetical protein